MFAISRTALRSLGTRNDKNSGCERQPFRCSRTCRKATISLLTYVRSSIVYVFFRCHDVLLRSASSVTQATPPPTPVFMQFNQSVRAATCLLCFAKPTCALFWTLNATTTAVDRLKRKNKENMKGRNEMSHNQTGRPGGLVILGSYYSIELVLEFESHVSRTFELSCKKENQRNQLLRAPSSVGRRNSMRVNEGRKEGLKSSRDQKEGAYDPSRGRGRRAGLLFDSGSELRVGGRRRKKKAPR